MKNPRQAAILAILDVRKGKLAQHALSVILPQLDKIDRPLCTDLVYGTLRARNTLQIHLAKFLKKPASLPEFVQVALEAGAYSLLYQSRVPAYAVINETVNIVKNKFNQKLANLANSVLRKVSEDKSRAGTSAHQDSSLPDGIRQLWQDNYGAESAEMLIRRSFERPWGGIRINSTSKYVTALQKALNPADKIGANGYAYAPGSLPKIICGHNLAYWAEHGALSFQAAGSQVIFEKLNLLEAWKNTLIWDVCAGFGNKTALMLENGLSVTLATDNNYARLANLPRECGRLGMATPNLAVADACYPPLKIWQGNILADVPCSGLGVLSRRPDIRERWNKNHTEELVKVQRKILDCIAAVLASGFEFCYMTCTLNPDENEGQIANFLQRHPKFSLLEQWQTPHNHPWLEGMYGARVVRME